MGRGAIAQGGNGSHVRSVKMVGGGVEGGGGGSNTNHAEVDKYNFNIMAAANQNSSGCNLRNLDFRFSGERTFLHWIGNLGDWAYL
jgi:hypothetical protein